MMIKAKPLGIAVQALGIRQLMPDSKIITEKDQLLTWTYDISPSPLGDTYGVKLIYDISKSPNVYVVRPDTLPLAEGKPKLPHCYDQIKQRLCLYYPDGKQWHTGMSLAKTIIPWIYDWLFHYEIWLSTGNWTGGGVHVQKENTQTNQPKSKLPFNTNFFKKEMSVTSISSNNKYLLWVLSAGRCQYRGCNKSLREDILTKKNFNQAYIAHIVADQPRGPRGDTVRSFELSDNISNLMLLCDTHHRLVDKFEVPEHSESLLLEMKKEHEDRIKRNTDIAPDMQSHILAYKANIGNFTPNVSYQIVSKYLLPTRYPAMSETIDLSTSNSLNKDNDPNYWSEEEANLERQFNRKLLQSFTKGEIKHLSIFAMAPMPLLVKLGTLVNNIYPAEIHQKVRVPDTWNLSDADDLTNYKLIEPNHILPTVALNISLSAYINNDRIIEVLGKDCSIFILTIDNPNTNFLQNKSQLTDFGTKIQEVFNLIKSKYSSSTPLHIFPSMPIATAIEMSRVWMPKADMPMYIYDENTTRGGFQKALSIDNT